MGGALVTRSEGEIQLGISVDASSGEFAGEGGIDQTIARISAGCGAGTLAEVNLEIRGGSKKVGFGSDNPSIGFVSVGIGINGIGDLFKANIPLFSAGTDGKGKLLFFDIP